MMMEVSYSTEIHFEPQKIYRVFADYQKAHPAILPKPYFEHYQVDAGGQGAGTVFTIVVNVLGNKQRMQMRVTEPIIGRVIEERTEKSDVITRFTIDPLANGSASQVTISTTMPNRAGWQGTIERWISSAIFKRIYRAELKNVAQYLRWQEAGELGIYS